MEGRGGVEGMDGMDSGEEGMGINFREWDNISRNLRRFLPAKVCHFKGEQTRQADAKFVLVISIDLHK